MKFVGSVEERSSGDILDHEKLIFNIQAFKTILLPNGIGLLAW